MATLVIAPNYRQFSEFVRQEALRVFPHAVNFRYVTRPELLLGHEGEIIIVNADQCDLLSYVEYHNDKRCPIRWVET